MLQGNKCPGPRTIILLAKLAIVKFKVLIRGKSWLYRTLSKVESKFLNLKEKVLIKQ